MESIAQNLKNLGFISAEVSLLPDKSLVIYADRVSSRPSADACPIFNDRTILCEGGLVNAWQNVHGQILRTIRNRRGTLASVMQEANEDSVFNTLCKAIPGNILEDIKQIDLSVLEGFETAC